VNHLCKLFLASCLCLDGRNHLCAPPPNGLHPTDTVFRFALGGVT
jgi:hypothetical protein